MRVGVLVHVLMALLGHGALLQAEFVPRQGQRAQRLLPRLLNLQSAARQLGPIRARAERGRASTVRSVLSADGRNTALPTPHTALPTPERLSPWVALTGAWKASTFQEFMAHVREAQGDVVSFHLWPVLPPTYLLQGTAANRAILNDLDFALEQILQELVNLLPVQARVPSEVDVALQQNVAQLFQSERFVNGRLPSLRRLSHQLRDKWLSGRGELDVFFGLSEYVLAANLQILYGERFTEKNGAQLKARFDTWVQNIANGQLVGFFGDLGELLREEIHDMQQNPGRKSDGESVLQVYLDSGSLDRLDEDSIVGLLSMTLMAAVFNTQVSLAWILVHLYGDAALLDKAREEIRACPKLDDYQELSKLKFLNSCIDESVRMHTMLPGNTVLRKTKRDIRIGDSTVKEGSVMWLYPNAVHLDDKFFPEPKKFCPYRLLKNKGERQQRDFELVTFGHGQKRCIGEKMARAMVTTFLAEVLPAMDATSPDRLPEDGLFDLIAASDLHLLDRKARVNSTA